jgi:hypothetical protein
MIKETQNKSNLAEKEAFKKNKEIKNIRTKRKQYEKETAKTIAFNSKCSD